MALIKCPECGKEVSDKATNCINCGYPLNEPVVNSTNYSNNKYNYSSSSLPLHHHPSFSNMPNRRLDDP